jgi:hypothetical protein
MSRGVVNFAQTKPPFDGRLELSQDADTEVCDARSEE